MTAADDREDGFHPLGERWEAELESMLEETEYDTELGFEMAEDAQRLVAGELTDAEFHAKYHERVLEEFGEDERPTADAFEADRGESASLLEALASLEGDGEQGRRELLKKLGVGGAAIGLGAMATGSGDAGADAPEARADEADGSTQWGMTLDLEVCDGCLSCVTACSSENNLDRGVNWMYIIAYEDETVSAPDNGQTREYPYLIRPCQHCADAPCEKVCPTTARHTRNRDGLVLTDYDICIGCRYCQVACPYGVNYFQWDEPDVSEEAIVDFHADEEGDHIHDERGRPVGSRAPRGVMSKCTFCPTRQDGHMGDEKVGTAACMEACPPGAIQFGDTNDPTSDASIYAEFPALGRALSALYGLGGGGPSPETVEDQLDELDEDELSVDDLDDLEDLSADQVAVFRAIEILTADFDVDTETDQLRSMGPKIGDVREILELLADAGLDLDDEAVLADLDLGDGDEDDAQERLQAVYGSPESRFRLLEETGTNPNVTYLGNEPGPSAEQVPGPVAYELGYERADGSNPSLVDDRKEVLDESTVDGGFFG